jgi:antitoxin component YwqK of YwqJK toxin-antitoxin module
MMSDSSVWQKDGSGVVMKWFDNGNISFAGRYIDWKIPHGKWQFFHSNSKVSALETYNNGVLSDKQYFDEDGKITDTIYHDRKAMFPGGITAWDKWLSKQLYFPRQYR